VNVAGFGEIAERLRRSTVQVFPHGRRHGGGSGIIWNSSGLVVTNAHVARSASCEIELWDGRRFQAAVGSKDPRRDLASLRISGGDFPAAPEGDSRAVRPGELVLAIGSPLGFAGALSIGAIHSTGPVRGMGRYDWIRAGVRLAPGNSGGPLANVRGEVIGVNTAVAGGLGLAVPSADLVHFLRRGPRPSLGVTLRPVRGGLMLLDVEPSGPAGQASLQPGDLLLLSFEELEEALDHSTDVLRLRFFRGGSDRVRETAVRLSARAEAA
jgi:serine protease Do